MVLVGVLFALSRLNYNTAGAQLEFEELKRLLVRFWECVPQLVLGATF
jgi:hypothetical protein